jgi:hypothetical protein
MPIRRSGVRHCYRTSGLTALNWDGTANKAVLAGRRAILFTPGTSGLLAAYPATYIWKTFVRNQVTTRTDGNRYSTTFFHGPNGIFTGGNNYYGAHPYPVPPDLPNPGDGKWELSTNSQDYTGRGTNQANNPSDPFVTFGRWYWQALVVSASGGNLNHKFYIDLPSLASGDFIEQNFAATYVAPGSPCLIWGQAPDNGSGASWGGYTEWEETNGAIRGVQVIAQALAGSDCAALAALEQDADVRAMWSSLGITTDWYLNMNWKLGDISDKRLSSQHNPSFVSTNGVMPTEITL